VKIMYHGI